jgi:hypothetical protein
MAGSDYPVALVYDGRPPVDFQFFTLNRNSGWLLR